MSERDACEGLEKGTGCIQCSWMSPTVVHKYCGDCFARLQAAAEIRAPRSEVESLRFWSESVAVCQGHTDEVLGENCLVCEVERLRSEVAAEREVRAALSRVIERAEAEVALLKRSLAMLGEPECERIEGVAWQDGDRFCPCDPEHQRSWVFVPLCDHDAGPSENERRAVLLLPDEAQAAPGRIAADGTWQGDAHSDEKLVGISTCPVCESPALSRCTKCGEEFWTYWQSMAQSRSLNRVGASGRVMGYAATR